MKRGQKRDGVSYVVQKTKNLFMKFVSGVTLRSKVLVIAVFCCNLLFVGIAVYRTYLPVYTCFEFNAATILEMIVSILLIVFFFIRLFASKNIFYFWFDVYAFIDVFTLPHVFVELVIREDWLGVRSLRFIWLIQFIDILKFIPWIKSLNTIDILAMVVRLLTVWLTAAGIIHALETTGDPWNVSNAQNVTFPVYAYFIMVTMSTVGYGDFSPKTAVGRAFITFFIIAGLAFFAAALPILVDAAEYYYRRRKYSKFDTSKVSQHIIVCGHITGSSMKGFLKDFLHKDRGDKYTHVLFLNPIFPDNSIKEVLQKYRNRVQYCNASSLCSEALQKSDIKTADACVILANKHSADSMEEDNSNILRLISLKNSCCKVRVIIQVLTCTSKERVRQIPAWKDTDIVLCLNELKLGILSHSSLCPGFSTFVANLFYTVGTNRSKKHKKKWLESYLNGADKELYKTKFSSYFVNKNMTFTDAARECYHRFSLILVAIGKGHDIVDINPLPDEHPTLLINEDTIGYFIGDDQVSVAFVSQYCPDCHGEIADRSKKCSHQGFGHSLSLPNLLADSFLLEDSTPASILARSKARTTRLSLACVHPRRMKDCLVGPDNLASLGDHVVLCVFGNKNSYPLGLYSFAGSLRNRKIPHSRTKPIVIIGDEKFLEKEWPSLANYPGIYVVLGSPLEEQSLRTARIHDASSCVIIKAQGGSNLQEESISDKEVILGTLFTKNVLKKTSMTNIIVTDIAFDSNVQFIDLDDDDEEGEVYEAQPYITGSVFPSSVFDSITTVAVQNHGAIKILYHLISTETSASSSSVLMPVELKSIEGEYNNFSELFRSMLDKNWLCLALYCKNGSNLSYLITAPSKDQTFDRNTDIVLVLKPAKRL